MKKIYLFHIALLLLTQVVVAKDFVVVENLSGQWKFSIGDNMAWAESSFDDSKWNNINVPGSWENQGYYGYDGVAWYRKSFKISPDLLDQNLYLELGYIDDVDEVYVNGVRIGSTGTFPPNYRTAYDSHRLYLIPKNILQVKGLNYIAVRVFDEHLEGGIIRGDIRLLKEKNPMLIDIDLQGVWKFKTGDNMNWANLKDYSDWSDILVPGMWENQGFNNYDGYAWYVFQFTPDIKIANEDLVLVLGKIDDIDQLYINGQFIASTGEFKSNSYEINCTIEYSENRGYYIPKGVILANTKNTIAVRVFDARGNGGIYEGPVGIISQKNYIQYWRNKKENQ